jgi:nitrous oxide reductase accessory protein NosL
MHKAVFSVLFMVIFVLSGSAHTAEKVKPTTCKVCNMKINESDKKYAVYVLEGIEPSAFDDIGCAIKWYNDECAMRQSAFDNYAIVHDYASGESVPAEKAFYVSGPEIKTPMGYGIVAFKAKDQAQKFANERETARVLNYQEVSSLKLK